LVVIIKNVVVIPYYKSVVLMNFVFIVSSKEIFKLSSFGQFSGHMLAAPQYKSRTDFHKKKVADYFPIFTVLEIICSSEHCRKVLTDFYVCQKIAQNLTI
jgi:hypothetical protein